MERTVEEIKSELQTLNEDIKDKIQLYKNQISDLGEISLSSIDTLSIDQVTNAKGINVKNPKYESVYRIGHKYCKRIA